MGFGGASSMHIGIFNLGHVKVVWGHSVHFSNNLGHNSDTSHCRAKRVNLGLGAIQGTYMGSSF